MLPPVRAEALRFLIHFVGDIAQPLHDEDNGDRGGNRVQVILGRRHTNLHAVWDVDVVRTLGRDPEEVASRLEHETPADKREWSAGNEQCPECGAKSEFPLSLPRTIGIGRYLWDGPNFMRDLVSPVPGTQRPNKRSEFTPMRSGNGLLTAARRFDLK